MYTNCTHVFLKVYLINVICALLVVDMKLNTNIALKNRPSKKITIIFGSDCAIRRLILELHYSCQCPENISACS